MNEILTNFGMNLAKYSVEIARHNGRKTVKDEDVILASKR
jgi:histone H3/H4